MSTKISALPAITAPNLTDAAYFPIDDATVTTTRATVAQLRTQLSTGNQSITGTLAVSSTITAGAGLTVTTGGLTVTAGTTTVQAMTHSGLVTISSAVASAAGTGTDIVLGATTQTTIGANGAATALTANPLGYLVFYKGATKCIIPYYNG